MDSRSSGFQGRRFQPPGPRYKRQPPPRDDRNEQPRQSYQPCDQPLRQVTHPPPPRSPLVPRMDPGCYVCGRFSWHWLPLRSEATHSKVWHSSYSVSAVQQSIPGWPCWAIFTSSAATIATRSQSSDVGRPESQQPSVTPTFTIGALPPGLAPGAAQHFGEVVVEPNDDASIYHLSSSQFVTCHSPRVSVKLADVPYSFLLDTGAELSVLPSCVLLDYHQKSSVIPHALVPCMVLQVEMLKIQDLITYQ